MSRAKTSRIITLIFIPFLLQIFLFVVADEVIGLREGFQESLWSNHRSAWMSQNPDQSDIQWFKEEMKISPKYLEQHEGIWGMSWAHFFTMVFLIGFFIGMLIIVYLRNKRIKQILNSLLREEENESES